ncbi:MAG TPA: TetR/AcrR family transcriptional regulator [Micropepsaceae bacterium]|nr:TetR/AcrR family transcriptional regulator [Micropepsaceae bacterium]
MSKSRKKPEPNVEKESPRVKRSRDAVLATTFELMSEGGIGGVSVDEISRRSGVAKTTIYRHWPSRSALLLDACAKLRPQPPIPDTGSLEGDLLAHAAFIARQLKSARWPTILPSIIDAAERDPEIAKLHAQLQAGFAYPYSVIIERAKKRGEVPARARALDTAALVSGPFFFRRWYSREPIDEMFVKSVVERALEALKARSTLT